MRFKFQKIFGQIYTKSHKKTQYPKKYLFFTLKWLGYIGHQPLKNLV